MAKKNETMGKYEALEKQREADGTAELVEIGFWLPEVEGEFIIGKITGVNVARGKYAKDYNQYIFDTDAGQKIANLGASIDLMHKSKSLVGRIFRFTYKGTRKVPNGNMKTYEVKEYQE